jgi:hypothetical protein
VCLCVPPPRSWLVAHPVNPSFLKNYQTRGPECYCSTSCRTCRTTQAVHATTTRHHNSNHFVVLTCHSTHVDTLDCLVSAFLPPPSPCQELHNGLQNTRMPYLPQAQTSRRNLFDFSAIQSSLTMARLLVLVNYGERIDVSARYTVSLVWSSEINSTYPVILQGLSQEIME